jgi:hypothetical protein
LESSSKPTTSTVQIKVDDAQMQEKSMGGSLEDNDDITPAGSHEEMEDLQKYANSNHEEASDCIKTSSRKKRYMMTKGSFLDSSNMSTIPFIIKTDATVVSFSPEVACMAFLVHTC